MYLINKLKPKHYLSGAIVIGFFQIVDGILGINHYRSSITTAFSLIELLWFLYTLIILLNFQYHKLNLQTPLLYIAYFVLSWLYGTYLLNTTDFPDGFVLPEWFPWVATAFGSTFCLSAYIQLRKLN